MAADSYGLAQGYRHARTPQLLSAHSAPAVQPASLALGDNFRRGVKLWTPAEPHLER
jgi:hypothetical protein